jgi:hypothetical protein
MSAPQLAARTDILAAMLQPLFLRELLVDPALHPHGQPHLSAASGLAQAGRWLYVAADDEHHLGRFAATGGPPQPVHLHRILAGDLPGDARERKRHKPDLEALTVLPPTATAPHGTLLALGSGSRPNRRQGFALPLDAVGEPAAAARAIDLQALYRVPGRQFADLNIEGAFVLGERLHLLQRGNRGDARNACIAYPLAQVQQWIQGMAEAPDPDDIVTYELGVVDGVALGFTDAAAWPGGGWVFSAVAEDTADSYRDGACGGSVLGWVAADGTLARLEALLDAPKVEGLAVVGGRLLMVTDADDPARAARLLALTLPP